MIKRKKTKNFYYAVAVMIGYIIGVGMFGLPYVVAQAGMLTFLVYLIIFGLIAYLLHLIYANLIVTTSSYHRLPGYAGKYLGKWGKYLAFFSKIVGNLAALLAYIIITGIFLHELLGSIFGGSEFIYATILFVVGAIVVYFGIQTIAKFELVMTGLLLLVVGLIIVKGGGLVQVNNYTSINWTYIFIPYGVMLFALDGCGSIPIVAKLLKKDKKQIKRVVQISTFVSVLVIFIFTIVIVGITGVDTSADALVGLKAKFSNGIILISLIFGVLTITTSFFLVSEAAKETLIWDFKVSKNLAWAIAVFVPYLLYLFGLRNLTNVIGFAGGVAGGISAIILVLIFRKLKKQKNKLPLFRFHLHNFILYLLITLFVCGLLYEIYYFLFSICLK